MTKKLIQHGNSWALVIDRPILDLLRIDPERQREFEAALAEVNEKFGRTLKRLAE